ncbi:hypothetical protein OG874_00220 [Nocardia sp. NBC_00565]|uniref:hypothetical protein n=1 Tax=Nocardia sp. NBC_00565 TaxID=2975993 RepID=UPI002E808A39|nr:hypothetical protein [Nocardia sp. NBC_00565]WUC03679.1 hypothetical protein OG874_00220 [Nocardia sp. NBC_00565]
MSPDRYGDSDPPTRCRDPRCGNGCPKGWIGYDDEGRPIPCLACKPHLAKTSADVNDYSERTPSARAQAAIDNEENRK